MPKSSKKAPRTDSNVGTGLLAQAKALLTKQRPRSVQFIERARNGQTTDSNNE